MHLKKPAILLGSYNGLPMGQQCTPSGNSPPPLSTRPTQCLHAQPRRQRRRLYATVQGNTPATNPEPSSSSTASSSSSAPEATLPWPNTGHPTRLPSPYQIFNQSPSAPYSKRRFYDLVKLYHPDRVSSHPQSTRTDTDPTDSNDPTIVLPHGECLTQSAMLERYRLVIAAHNILSNQDKRAAYDRAGLGWSLYRDTHDPTTAADHANGLWSTVHRWRTGGPQWPRTEDDCMYNATWEDWERWYERRRAREWAAYRAAHGGSARAAGPGYFTAGGAWSGDGRRQGTIFASNYVFISVVALLAALGGVGQATRAHEGAKNRIERARLVSEENSRMLMQARQDATQAHGDGEGKRERIKRFLQEREGYEGDFDGRVLRGDDDALCAPKVVSERSDEPFWRRPPENR